MKIKESDSFKRIKSKLDKSYLERVEKLVRKIILNPEIGKPMRHDRKGTREVYAKPFRLSYFYDFNQDILTFLDFYHKDEQWFYRWKYYFNDKMNPLLSTLILGAGMRLSKFNPSYQKD